ncbi:MAG TPA: hypothetical protein VF148_16385 [Acidimicrobiia bacterium]
MTATIKRPGRRKANQRRRIRFSSLETLGFTDVASSWTDSPSNAPQTPRGRHLAKPPKPEEVADWRPHDFGRRLDGSNVRWGMITAIILLLGGLGGLGYWLYQRPVAVQQAAEAELTTQVATLEAAIPLLTELNQSLLSAEPASDTTNLDSVENVARDLFDTSALLTKPELRSAASKAANSALDGVRLIRETHAYSSVVLPMLEMPSLETDRDLIALDEAARSFGDWQLAMDNMRTALPDGVLPDVTQQLDILSGDLTSFLGRYVDALRQDQVAAVNSVLGSLSTRLGTIADALTDSVGDIQARIQIRIDETATALGQIVSR